MGQMRKLDNIINSLGLFGEKKNVFFKAHEEK